MSESSIAFFISPHGFGHAARGCAVIAALQASSPGLRVELFTSVPRWFFEDSIAGPLGYNSLLTDVGLVQEDSLHEDISKTVERLDEFLPFDSLQVERLAGQVQALNCRGIICDIAPLGIAVARSAGIPSVLVENFTWDWIYEGYVEEEPRLARHIAYLDSAFRSAGYHIQTEPVCRYARADLVTRPVSRAIKSPPGVIRSRLGIPAGAQAVLITMGGILARHAFIDRLADFQGIYFIVPGAVETRETRGNTLLLPHLSDYYHPDLLNACDAVIGKSGYSTVAEAFHSGIPFGYVSRARFREADTMAKFIQTQMHGFEIRQADFEDGSWLLRLSELLALPRLRRDAANGSRQVADFIRQHIL